MRASLVAPCRSAFPARKLYQLRPQAAITMTKKTTRMGMALAELLPACAIRSVTVHGPTMRKKTGRPRQAAASMRSLAPVAASLPVQAARATQLDSGVQEG